VEGNKVTLCSAVQLSTDNKLVQMTEATIGENDSCPRSGTPTESLTITMTSQGTTPPVPSDFNLPSVCNAPNGNNQNSQGNEEEQCTDTIPGICLGLGTPGAANCHGQTVSALSQLYGTLDAAAAALGFPSVKALQKTIEASCG